ncbi:DUF305 domain-containing protein [Lentzea sp. NPDC042327]|uniref:DUF305 domain-containing protein n=1 Tax=Lentzea sp. NPDC042327 TaxID=3154801 RepID=UPI0033C9B862
MRVLHVAVVLLAAVLPTGCGAVAEAPPAAVPSPAVSSPAVSSPAGPTATDLAFVDLVIPQNESALAALALVAGRPGSALRPVAEQFGAGYRAELVQAREVLARAGRPESGEHAGHDMPGMITPAELAAAGGARDADFDGQLRTLLRTQCEEARTVARAELSAGTSRQALDLGARIERSRAEFLVLLGS